MTDQWGRFEDSVRRYTKIVPAQTFNYSINISLQHKYVFVETPKVCCSTIKLNLQRLETELWDFIWPENEDVHDRNFSPLIRPTQVLDFERLLDSKYLFKFCFVRNPYSRLLSCYLDKIAGNRPPKQAILNILDKGDSGIDAHVSFSEFVEAISSQTIVEMNPHWRPQYYQTFQDLIEYDFIGRYENFTRDFEHVLARISPDNMLNPGVEARHGTDADDKIARYYTIELLQKVNELFAIDFNAFEYPKIND